jgi:hypothetical protein
MSFLLHTSYPAKIIANFRNYVFFASSIFWHTTPLLHKNQTQPCLELLITMDDLLLRVGNEELVYEFRLDIRRGLNGG